MQLTELSVQGLFGKYDHKVSFPTSGEDEARPSVVIIHGPNGVGKTTILRMLSGMMRLDFSLFRAIPFSVARLSFSTGKHQEVTKREDGVLAVTFDGTTALLDPGHSGPWRPEDQKATDALRSKFMSATESLTYEYLGASRVQPTRDDDPASQLISLARLRHESARGEVSSEDLMRAEAHIRSREHPRNAIGLSEKVQRFIADAQLDYGTFFRSSDPDLFLRIISDLSQSTSSPVRVDEFRDAFARVHTMDAVHARLGLGRDDWDFDELMRLLDEKRGQLDDRSLAVIGTYADFLESRANKRQLVAERLVAFEEVLADFFTGKTVQVDARRGVTISSEDGLALDESQLSSGEYQLLYLMVAALTTRRRGTIIAIDEPELSMHIAWQRRLVPSLIRCASRAAPQLVLATHSPDIAAGYPESMTELGAG